MQWYVQALKNYFNFSGRARRKEYWMFNLIHQVILAVLYLIPVLSGGGTVVSLTFGIATLLYVIGTAIPAISVTVRRLHDIGYSGWWMLMPAASFLAMVVGIVLKANVLVVLWAVILLVAYLGLFIASVLDSQPSENQYGPNPKAVS